MFCGSASFLDALSHTTQLWSIFSPSKALAAALHPLYSPQILGGSTCSPEGLQPATVPIYSWVIASLKAGRCQLKRGSVDNWCLLGFCCPLPPPLPPSQEEITEDEVEAAPKGLPGPRAGRSAHCGSSSNARAAPHFPPSRLGSSRGASAWRAAAPPIWPPPNP